MAAAPSPLVFSTEALPPRQRLDAWNDAFGGLNDIREPGAGGVTHSVNWVLGGMVVGESSVPPSLFERTAAHARRDALDHWVIRVLRHGSNRLRVGGFQGTLLPGRPMFFSMHEPWESRWSDAEWVSLCVPRDLDPRLSAGLARQPEGPIPGPFGDMVGDVLLALPARLRQAGPTDLPALADAVRALLAACVGRGAAAQPRPSDKERVRRVIREHIASARLTPARLAALTGMSRSGLYRLFEEEGGVAGYVQSLRLALACAALRDPARATESIAAIGEAHGFPDASVFARAFRQAYGTSPREMRAATQVGLPPPATLQTPPATRAGSSRLSDLLYSRRPGRAA